MKPLIRKLLPVARRVLGESHEVTLKVRYFSALALFNADGATLDDQLEAAMTLEDTERIARRVFGGAHPSTTAHEDILRTARAALRARETPPGSSS